MPKTVPTYAQIRDRYLQAVVNQAPDAAIGPDSDHFVRASATAAVVEGLYAHVMWVFRQAFPDLADADLMEKAAAQRGVTRKGAAFASGTVRFSGVAGTAVAAGQAVSTAQGVAYASTAAVVVGGGGTVDAPATATVAGAAGNQSPNTPATVASPPSGIAASAVIVLMTGGAEVESDASLLDRFLLRLGEDAQGGNATDYERWARSVAGVERAYVFDCRRGAGTVDVVPLPATGLPGSGLLAAVQAVLDVKRPVGMRPTTPVLALAPTAVETDVVAALTLASGYTLADVEPLIDAAIARVFAALGPGDTLVRAQLIAAILSVPGVTDVTLTAPAANVTSSVGPDDLEMVTLGATTLT